MDRVYLNELYDFYSELLTEKEKLCFLDYYADDLSLSEIAENNEVSRNAIHKTIRNVEEKLVDYENKIGLGKLKKKLKNIKDLDDLKTMKEALGELV